MELLICSLAAAVAGFLLGLATNPIREGIGWRNRIKRWVKSKRLPDTKAVFLYAEILGEDVSQVYDEFHES